MKIKVRDIKELLNLHKDEEVLEFENLTAIYAIVKKDILKDINQHQFGSDFDLDTQNISAPIVPSDIPNTINLTDIQEFIRVAKSIFCKSKKVSDGIPYGMLKHGVDFALDDKLYRHYLSVCGNAGRARVLKVNMYKKILNANEQYWKID